MNVEQQVIFLFSAFGGINGILLSGYFLFRKNKEGISDYLLSGLLMVMSLRTIKSVFHYFNAHLFEQFVQVGLGACFLIGPFLYLYTTSVINKEEQWKQIKWLHIIPYIVAIVIFSFYYSYYDDRTQWRWLIEVIYKQWLIYIILSAYSLKELWKKAFQGVKLESYEFWLLNIWTGVTIVYIAFETVSYTSYIVGALSFTFLLYTSILWWIYQQKDKKIVNEEVAKYANSTLDDEQINAQYTDLESLMKETKPYLDSALTLDKLSKTLKVSSKELSQIINQKSGSNYSQYIADYRITDSKDMLRAEKYAHYKISAIAFECGFNSLSSFNYHFKRVTGNSAIFYRNAVSV